MNRSLIAVLLTIIMCTPGCMSTSDSEFYGSFHGDLIENGKTADDFTLITNDNQTYNFKESTEGKVVIIAFLFTNCYDICPIVTHNLRIVHEALNQSQLDKIEFLTITVDPWRDNTSILTEWKLGTKSNWTHLTINDIDAESPEFKELSGVWNNFNVGFSIETNQTEETSGRHHPGDYDIEHSTGTILIDHNGYQRIWWGDYDWIIDLVQEDLLELVSQMDDS
ncbi:MAG: SCO family protein [Euryarchaeota archaeon TMED248]|nr:MAG: SCO family protein [Euryarchaeota archaeon TMED248]